MMNVPPGFSFGREAVVRLLRHKHHDVGLRRVWIEHWRIRHDQVLLHENPQLEVTITPGVSTAEDAIMRGITREGCDDDHRSR